jgi:putative DNA primase/helicase
MNEASRLREDEGLVGAYVELILGGMDEAEIGALWDELVSAKGREFAGRVEAEVVRRHALLQEQISNKTDVDGSSRQAAIPAVTPEEVAVPGAPPPAEALPEQTSNKTASAGEKAEAEQAEGPAVLNANDPNGIAREFVARCCREGGKQVVWFWNEKFWRWNGRFYQTESDNVIGGEVTAFLDGAKRAYGVSFMPRQRNVEEVLYFVKKGLDLSNEIVPPSWIEGTAALDWLVCGNKAVNVRTGEEREHSPDLFAHSAVDWDWQPEAKCPEWRKFLGEVLPGDEEAWASIEEWLGYNMTSDTRFQKAMGFVGLWRSGKGTICDVLRGLVGDSNFVDLQLNEWLKGEKSAQVLLGKRAIVFGDVRLKEGRTYGANFDPGGLDPKSMEMLLKITGNNSVTIPRMWAEAWFGKLGGKVTMVSNKVLNFNDGALVKRFIVVHFVESLAGKEDVDLFELKLRPELPGIAARCLAAYRRLCHRGKFIQPASGKRLVEEVLTKSEPFAAAIRACFEADPGGVLSKDKAYTTFVHWCERTNNLQLVNAVPKKGFYARLREVRGFEGIIDGGRPEIEGRREYVWAGVRLRCN